MTSSDGRLPLNQILVGDSRSVLQTLPAASVDCVITSPPYFGLRDYGHPDQLGLESAVGDWVRGLRDVCAQLARVLKPTGALWLNVADRYSAHPRQGGASKSLLLGPSRLALALAHDGWLVRNQVIWHKPNAMPHSVTDRLTNRYELMWLLVRNHRYFFDLDAIRQPATSANTKTRHRTAVGYPPAAVAPRGGNANGALRVTHAHPLGKNPGDVWSIATAGFRGTHFATFPVGLAERPLLATCPERVCSRCGMPWRRNRVDRARQPPAMGTLRPACGCESTAVPGVVLDPFMGAGTTAVVAEKHGRDWLGIELNPDFAELARERIHQARAAPEDRAA